MSTSLSAIRQSIGDLMGAGDAAMIMGTPTGTYSTTGFAASGLGAYETDFFKDWNLRIYAGTHKDTSNKIITAFTTSTGLFVFSGALAVAIDATDLFELHRDFTAEEINRKINLAINMVENEALSDKVDETLIANDVLTDGLFEIWSSSSALTNWTKGGTGTLAQESSIKREGSYSAKLTNTVSNAFWIYQAISNYALYAGKTASLYARVNCATADRARIRLTDGVNTWNSDYHDGTGWRESASPPYLKIENVTLSTLATELTASFRIETGTAINAYVDKMFLVCGDRIFEYTLPTGFYTLESVWREGSVLNDFGYGSNRFIRNRNWRSESGILDGRLWQILGTSTRKLWIDPDRVTLTNGRKLRLVGQALASQLTLDADTTPIGPSYLVQQAVAILHQSRITGDNSISQRHEFQMKIAQAIADRERIGLRIMSRGERV